jgi:pyruvate dehydrogenase E1 component beta subunit
VTETRTENVTENVTEIGTEILSETVTDNGEQRSTTDAGVVETTYREAMRTAIRQAMLDDDRVIVLGEDVADYGGTYAVTKGLHEEFGRDRVRNTPLSESGFVGAGIGAALGGLRPIVEIMTVNFSLLALDQIVNTAATLLHMSGGQLNVPVVIRMTTGAGRQLAAQHSHSLEGWYAHVPGLQVIAPATIDDARWMLPTALADPNPVIIFEHNALYGERGLLDTERGPVDIDRAAVRRHGDDITLVASGGMVPKALASARQLADAGISADVIDLRSLRPLDADALQASVMRTNHAMVIDEGWQTGGLSAEVAALITERCFWSLDAPVRRLASAEVPIPYARHLEEHAIPQVDDIVAAATRLLETGR